MKKEIKMRNLCIAGTSRLDNRPTPALGHLRSSEQEILKESDSTVHWWASREPHVLQEYFELSFKVK